MVDADSNGKFKAKEVKQGDLIRSADWNAANKEIERLGKATTNLNQNDFQGALTIEEALTVKGDKVDIGEKEKNTEVNLVGNINVSKTVKANKIECNSVEANKFDGVGALVKGMIMMWSGELENIPPGWVLCDGENDTPDLQDRFIVGSGKRKIGKTGGKEAEEIILKTSNIPQHSHEINIDVPRNFVELKYSNTKQWKEGGASGNYPLTRNGENSIQYDTNASEKPNITCEPEGNRHPSPITITLVPSYYTLAFIIYVGIQEQ